MLGEIEVLARHGTKVGGGVGLSLAACVWLFVVSEQTWARGASLASHTGVEDEKTRHA